MIETCMKNVSDDLLGEKKLVPENMEKTDEELRDLLGVMRVGALSANTGKVINLSFNIMCRNRVYQYFC
jgi:hypothetical protein